MNAIMKTKKKKTGARPPAGYGVISSRIFCKMRFSSRDTCTWEMPRRSATSDCV